MKKSVIALLAFAVGVSGCSSANVSAHSGNFTTSAGPPVGTSVSGGSVSVSIQGGSASGAFAAFAAIVALMGLWRDAPSGRTVPDMLEGRGISEVDCTQPIVDWTKNLKCR